MTPSPEEIKAALLPCPFCDGDIILTEEDDPQFYFNCNTCGHCFNHYAASVEGAIAMMNTRAALQPQAPVEDMAFKEWQKKARAMGLEGLIGYSFSQHATLVSYDKEMKRLRSALANVAGAVDNSAAIDDLMNLWAHCGVPTKEKLDLYKRLKAALIRAAGEA